MAPKPNVIFILQPSYLVLTSKLWIDDVHIRASETQYLRCQPGSRGKTFSHDKLGEEKVAGCCEERSYCFATHRTCHELTSSHMCFTQF